MPVADPAHWAADLLSICATPWPRNRMVHIVCHGHSVPAGYFKTPVVDTFNAYPHLLHRGIKQRYPWAVVNVTVTAIGGEDSVAGASRFERDVLALRPDIVTIDYGLNDRRPGLEKAKAAWEGMIQNAKRRGAKVLLLTPTDDLSADLDNPDDPLLRHADQIRRLADTHGTALVDSLELWQDHARRGGRRDAWMSQGNHPNADGHRRVAEEMLRWFPPRTQSGSPSA